MASTRPAVVLPTVLNNPALPQVPYTSALRPIEFERGLADEHWIFDQGGADGLYGGISSLPMIQASPITGMASIAVSAGGSGYTSAPAVAITGGGGSGAAALAVLTAGVVTSILVTNAGKDYTSAPAVAFSGGGGAGAAATATLDGTPTYSAAYLTTKSGGLNGLLSPYVDAAVQTEWLVARKDALAAGILAHILMGSATTAGGEGGHFLSQASVILDNTRAVSGGGNQQITGSSAPATGSWIFVAVSQSLTQRIIYLGGLAPLTVATVKTATTVGKRNAIANAHYASAGYDQGVAAFEYGYSSGALTAADLADIYARAKIRAGRRGLTIY